MERERPPLIYFWILVQNKMEVRKKRPTDLIKSMKIIKIIGYNKEL